MKELIYLGTEVCDFNKKKYNISTFIDVFNYEILKATDLPNHEQLVKGNKYLCDLDVKYKLKEKKFVFYVTKVSI